MYTFLSHSNSYFINTFLLLSLNSELYINHSSLTQYSLMSQKQYIFHHLFPLVPLSTLSSLKKKYLPPHFPSSPSQYSLKSQKKISSTTFSLQSLSVFSHVSQCPPISTISSPPTHLQTSLRRFWPRGAKLEKHQEFESNWKASCPASNNNSKKSLVATHIVYISPSKFYYRFPGG